MTETRSQARGLLRRALENPTAAFHDHQLEAIEALVDSHARLLVVQRTGWGKSMVYFVATAILRSRGRGPTVIVSPLLSLMRNQLTAAGRLGLSAATINCENSDEHGGIFEQLRDNAVDILLIAPERFANAEFREKVLTSLGQRVGMLVVDEAHCISDWGHDFRPDYRRIARVVQTMPPNLPVLATTATANDRVVDDVLAQIGSHAQIVRGTLRRDSLHMQNLTLPDYSARLAWLAQTLQRIPGSGIVYALTIRDTEVIARWLSTRGITAHSYCGKTPNREDLETGLIENRFKVLVATTALGMGFDKPDLGFVIHFQRPGSVIHYYQQVGRAGRGISSALGVLLSGHEDDDIARYFIENALPDPELVSKIVDALRNADENGLSAPMLAARFNTRKGKIDQILKILETESPSPVTREGYRWFPTPVEWSYDAEHAERLTAVRRHELEQMTAYVDTTECLQVFLARELDAPDLEPCGKCANCMGNPIIETAVDPELISMALEYLKRLDLPIVPRKRWPGDALETDHGWMGSIAPGLQVTEGRALCRWGDPGWGALVRDGKHGGHFDTGLVEAAVDLINQRWHPEARAEWVTCVPSLRHGALVPDFARRLADRLDLPFVECVEKVRETRPQKGMNDSWNQARNLADAFATRNEMIPGGSVLLIDDMVDSKWTFTIVGALLREGGAGPVLPFALADTSQTGD